MAEREKLVYIVLDEANRPTSLGAFEDGDTIASGTLPTNVRTAVEDVDTLNTRVDNLDTSVGDLSTAIDAIEVGAVDASVLAAAQFVTDSSGDIVDTSNTVVTLNTRVDNLDTSVGDLSTAIDAIVVVEIDASVLAAAQFVTDSSGDIIDTSNAVVTLDTRVGNVETSTADLSTYINSNESSWAAGLDAGTLADITAVSTVVTTTSGANENIVTSYGPFSGNASGVSAAATVFTSVNGTTAVLGRSIDGGNNNLTGVNLFGATTGNITTGNINNLNVTGDISVTGGVSAEGAVSGGSTATFDGQIKGGSLRSEDTLIVVTNTTTGGNITTTTGNITATTGNITATAGNLIAGGFLSAVGNSNIDGTLTVDLDVTANGVSVTGLDGRVTTAESDITTLQTDVAPVTDLVTAYGPVSGGASGVSGAAAVFASVNGTTAVINRNLDFNAKTITNAGTINGFNLATLDSAITTNTNNITALQASDSFPVTSLTTALDANSNNISNVASLDATGDIKTTGNFSGAGSVTVDGSINGVDISQLESDVDNIDSSLGTLQSNFTALQASDSFPVTSLTTVLDANSNNITNAGSIEGTSLSVDTANINILNSTGTEISVSKPLDLEGNILRTNTINPATSTDLQLSTTTQLQLLSADKITLVDGGSFTTTNFGACCVNWNSNYNTAQGYDTVGWDATKTIVDNNVTGIVNIVSEGFGSSGLRIGTLVYPIDQTIPPSNNNILKYNDSSYQWELGSLAFEVDGGTGVATPVSEVTQITLISTNLDIQSNLNVSSPSGTVTFGSQQTFTPSSNTFSTRNILIGNELSSGPECVVNLEGSTIWASGSVLSAGSGCNITLRGDKFFYGPTNIYGPLGTDLDLDGNNLIDVNNVTTANSPLTLQVTGAVTAGALNIKNTATGIGTSGAINVEAVGNVSVSAGDTVDITAPTVNLDGTGLFGLSGGAVQIEATSTFVTIDANAYLNITAGTNLNLNSADNGTQSVNIDGCPFPNPFYQVRANTGLDINSATNVAVTFSAVDVSGGGKVASHYSSDFGTTPTSFQVDTAGIYEVSFNIMVYDPASTVAQRSTHIAQITKNGTVIGPGAIGYVRSNSGSNEASYNMNGYILSLSAGDDIGINFERVATTTSTTEILPGYDHILTIKRIG